MRYIFFLFIFTISFFAKGQSALSNLIKQELGLASDTTHLPEKNIRIFGLPSVFYSPETKWGFGVAGIVRFKTKNEPDSMRRSTILFGASVTELGQTGIDFPFQLWLKKEKYNIYGDIGYQKFNYLFYGVGNHAPVNFYEKYYIEYPKLRLTVLKRVFPHLYGGIRYVFDKSDLYRFSPSGELVKGSVAGSPGGVVSGAGGTIKFDNRDNQFYPRRGFYAEVYGLTDSKITGSDYTFNKFSIDLATYAKLGRKHVLAFNAWGVLSTGNVPFYHMALLGGSNKLRGFYQGRYRDRDAWALQAEYRIEVFWRIGLTAFAGLGQVASYLNEFNAAYTRFAYGAGLRGLFDKKQHINARFDIGVGNGQLNYYFTIGEAF